MNVRFIAALFFLLLPILTITGCEAIESDPRETSAQTQADTEGAQTESPARGGGKNNTKTYSYRTEELYAYSGENQIYGVIYVPENAEEKLPAVIFSHGFGGNYRVGAQYAEILAENGYAVYCFDFCGGSPGSRSDGSTLEMSIFTEKDDLDAVIETIRGLDYIDGDNIFLMGSSQGGAVSAIAAAERKEDIRGMILLYPAFVLADRASYLKALKISRILITLCG